METDKSENNSQKFLYLALAAGFAARILFLIFFTDLNNLEFYEYGAIAENLHAGNGYSLFYFSGNEIEYEFNPEVKPFVSGYIQPGYVFFLYPFFFINDFIIRNLFIIFFQILISMFVIILMYKFTELVFDKKAALAAAFIYALLPEFIVAVNSINSVTFFHTGLLIIFILLNKINLPDVNHKGWILIGLLFGILILFRSETLLFLVIVTVYFFSKRLFKPSLIILAISLITIFPWQLRNIIVFEEFVPLSTSLGINFYRGHNPYAVGVWADEKIVNELKKYKDEAYFELKMNQTMFSFGIQSIKQNPGRDLLLSLEKIIHLWLFNYNNPRTFHALYIIPSIGLMLFFIFGVYNFFSWEKHNYILFFLVYFTIIIFIFFPLTRYQTMMKIVLLPFAAKGLLMLYQKLYFRLKN